MEVRLELRRILQRELGEAGREDVSRSKFTPWTAMIWWVNGGEGRGVVSSTSGPALKKIIIQ